MFPMVTKIIKWVALPVLLIASVFSRYAASYELLIDFVICMGAIIFVQRAVRLKEYLWAIGFVAIAVVFSPLVLVIKIFLLLGFACLATFVALLAAFRTQPYRWPGIPEFAKREELFRVIRALCTWIFDRNRWADVWRHVDACAPSPDSDRAIVLAGLGTMTGVKATPQKNSVN